MQIKPRYPAELDRAVSDTNGELGWAVSDTNRLLFKLIDQRLAPIGLSRAQWRVLFNLERQGPITHSMLADLIEVKTSTVTPLVNRMVAKGLLERRPHPTDGRVKFIVLTDKAIAMFAKVEQRIGPQMMEDIMSDLSLEARDGILSGLKVLSAGLQRLLEAETK